MSQDIPPYQSESATQTNQQPEGRYTNYGALDSYGSNNPAQQPYAPYPSYPVYQTMPERSSKNGLAIAGFVLGIIGMLAWILPILGYPITITGIVLAAIGINSTRRTLAIWGIVLSILALVLSIGNSMLGVYLSTLQ